MAPSSRRSSHNHRRRQPLLMQLMVAIAAAHLLPCCWASIVADDPEALLQTLRDRAETVRICSGVPGLAVGYVHGRERRTFGLGVADLSTKQPVTGSTLFGIGSLTKAFSSALLAELLPKHGLRWDSLLKDIIPGFRMNTTLLTDHVTLADALAHRTGVTQFDFPIVLGYPPSVGRRELERRTQFHVPTLQFRTAMSYNNHMYAVGGATVEHFTGKKWEDLVKETFFVPLKMESSSFAQFWRTVPYLSKMHYDLPSEENLEIPFESLETVTPFGPAGSILCSAKDMVEWLSFNLERVRNGSDTWSTVFTSQVPVNGDPHVNGAGLGWMRGQYGDVPFWEHGGSIGGFCSSAVLLQAQDSALFFTVNKWCGSVKDNVMNKMARMLAETILGLPLTANASAICESLGVSTPDISAGVGGVPVTSETVLGHDLQCVVGTFSHPAYGDIVTASNGSAVTWSYGRSTGTLVPVATANRIYALRFEGWLEVHNYLPLSARALNFSADCQRLQPADFSGVSFWRRGDVPSSAGSFRLSSSGTVALASLVALAALAACSAQH